jgi:hypothetical protein
MCTSLACLQLGLVGKRPKFSDNAYIAKRREITRQYSIGPGTERTFNVAFVSPDVSSPDEAVTRPACQ